MHIETERKFLIKLPSEAELSADGCRKLDMVQTYLTIDSAAGTEERVRKITEGDRVRYVFTEKKKISAVSRYENEYDITAERYDSLIDAAEEPRQLTKTRYVVPYGGHNLEIDVYPREIGGDALDGRAVLEVELDAEEEDFVLPDYIIVERELTGKSEFSNKVLAKSIASRRLMD